MFRDKSVFDNQCSKVDHVFEVFIDVVCGCVCVCMCVCREGGIRSTGEGGRGDLNPLANKECLNRS